MTYKQTLDFLYSQLPMFQRQGAAAYKADLSNTIALCEMLNNPQNDFPSIHIAGTNGKGSTANMLASVFQQAGYKTGLYTSPHLVDFRERIRVNGEMLSQEYVVSFVEQYSQKFIKIQPSFFEITFAMAIDYFHQQEVDIVIMETGMGGRLDSTNVVNSILSIITNIGLDHTAFLGNTLKKIAGEKAGIIKNNIPVLIGEKQAEISDVFESKAVEKDAPIFWAENMAEINTSISDYEIIVGGNKWAQLKFPLEGVYQQKNLRTAIAAIVLLQEQWKLDKRDIILGLENIITNTNFAGRWQVLQNNPQIILDTGHNTEGLQLTMVQLKNMSYNKLHFVLGMVNDKDISKALELLPKDAQYYFCKANIPRGLSADILKEEANKHNLKGRIYDSVSLAFVSAKENTQQEDLIFVGGSTFTVAEVLENIK